MWSWKLGVLLLCFFSFSNGQNLTRNFDKIALPDRFVDSVQNVIKNNKDNISLRCKLDLVNYINALVEPKFWALSMFDAASKIPSGILSGNVNDLGQFDQCLNIENIVTKNSSISGKYCLGSIPLASLISQSAADFKRFETPETRMMNPNGAMTALFATCLPDSCSANDIQQLYSRISIKMEFFESLCQSKSTQPGLTGYDIATISFLSVIFFIMLVSTAYDVYLFYFDKKPLHSLLIAFSAFSNGKKLIATTNSSAQLTCLAGLRVISMMWVILGHRYETETALPQSNYLNIFQWMYDSKNMFILQSNVSVDTFFVVGGLLVSYSFMAAMKKGVKFNIIMFYVHRYLRLTPVIAVIILIYVTILKHLGSGPVWYHSAASIGKPCEEYWWSALLYVQNYVNPEQSCIGQTWYLSVDTQLFFISPVILLPLKMKPLIGLIIAGVLLFGSTLASFLIGWFDELYGFMLANQGPNISNFLTHYYVTTHTRAGPWLMGLMLGYWIYEIKLNHKKTPMNKILALLLWVIALTIMCVCVFTGHNTSQSDYEYNRVANSFYIALLRPGWALGICWVIFACVTGYGGPVNWFLSLPMFQVASRFTYSMYLIHMGLDKVITGQMRTSNFFSNLQMLYVFWGDFAFTFGTAIIFTLAFESPIIVLEKVIFGTGKEKPKPAPSAPSLENGKKSEIP